MLFIRFSSATIREDPGAHGPEPTRLERRRNDDSARIWEKSRLNHLTMCTPSHCGRRNAAPRRRHASGAVQSADRSGGRSDPTEPLTQVDDVALGWRRLSDRAQGDEARDPHRQVQESGHGLEHGDEARRRGGRWCGNRRVGKRRCVIHTSCCTPERWRCRCVGRNEGAGGEGLDHGGLKNPAGAPMMPAGHPRGFAIPHSREAIS
jgi:hypothetical protein